MHSPHSLTWNNCRFYYNPNEKLLEMIPYDSNSGDFNSENTITSYDLFFGDEGMYLFNQQIFNDSIFLSSYFSQLNIISNRKFLSDFFSKINHNLQKQIDILCIDDYDFNYDLRNKIFNRQLSLQRFLDEPNALSIRITDCNKLEVGNKTTKPLIIYSVINKKK